jgi:hypothetical protein
MKVEMEKAEAVKGIMKALTTNWENRMKEIREELAEKAVMVAKSAAKDTDNIFSETAYDQLVGGRLRLPDQVPPDSLLPAHLTLGPPALDKCTLYCMSLDQTERVLSDFELPGKYLEQQRKFLERRLTSSDGVLLTKEDIDAPDHIPVNWRHDVIREAMLRVYGIFPTEEEMNILRNGGTVRGVTLRPYTDPDEQLDSAPNPHGGPVPKFPYLGVGHHRGGN